MTALRPARGAESLAELAGVDSAPVRRALLSAALVAACSPAPIPSAPAPSATGATSAAQSAAVKAPPPDYAAKVSQSRLDEDVAFIARPRPPGSDHWRAVQQLCAERLRASGFEVSRGDGAGPVNVVGVKRGATLPEEHVVLSAHYDHLPECAGADDNASGVAGVLESARALGEATFARTLVVACWDAEEAGMNGSRAWVEGAKARQLDVVASLVLEMIGYRSVEPRTQELPAGFELLFPEAVARVKARGGSGDFIALIANPKARQATQALRESASRQGLPVEALEVPPALLVLPAAADLLRSDHEPFWTAGYPAVQLTDTADFRNPYYHCHVGPDAPETLDYAFLANTVRTVVSATAQLLQAP